MPAAFRGIDGLMNKIRHILKTQFDIECADFAEVQGGLSAMNYKIHTDDRDFFLKVYDKKRLRLLCGPKTSIPTCLF